MNILVLAPHPDDEAIGCGGAICLHADRGDRVVGVFLTSGELGLKHLAPAKAQAIREGEARKAGKILGLRKLFFLRQPDWGLRQAGRAAAKALRPIIQREEPQLIYLPHPREWHPDHRAVLPVLRAALRAAGLPPPELRGYEVWTPNADHDHLENITAVMPRKLRAIGVHRSQLKEFNYLRAVRGLNQFRGELAGKCEYAEVFKTL